MTITSSTFPEMRKCKRCEEVKLVLIHFRAKKNPKVCKECHTKETRIARQKRTGADPKRKWGYFNFVTHARRKDPRDKILQVA